MRIMTNLRIDKVEKSFKHFGGTKIPQTLE